MILQALNRYYDILLRDPNIDIAPPGYTTTSVSYALNLASDGELLDLIPLFQQEQRGKKIEERPLRMVVPEQVKRTAGPVPNFLCDNPAFVLGMSDKPNQKPDYAQDRFTVFRKFHLEMLAKVSCDAARAVLGFLQRYDIPALNAHPAVQRYRETLLKGGNLVFMFRDEFAHRDPQIIRAWEEYKSGKVAVMGQCLVSGEIAPIARLHPSLKGIPGANATGASLVGFNAPAYESYNREKGQGLNSPVSEKAAFAYTTVLNHLLSSANENRKVVLGDTTLVYWAESENPAYAAAFSELFAPSYQEPVGADSTSKEARDKGGEKLLGEIAQKVRQARAVDLSALTESLDGRTRFYILGLSPNSARISVRFFLTDPFEEILAHILSHYRDLEIIKEFENQPSFIPIRSILAETVSQKAKDPKPAPLLEGSLMRSILAASPYPAGLYNAILTRIRVDMDDSDRRIRKINYVRAAVVKACLVRKYRAQPHHSIQEVLCMSLNEQSAYPPYVLGRLFAVLEKAQQEALPEINATIKDRYFTSACATPAAVFPVLIRLSQHYISKAEYGYVSDRRIQDILNLLDIDKNPIPARLNLDEQGAFILGYYHQRAAFYVRTDRNANTNANHQE